MTDWALEDQNRMMVLFEEYSKTGDRNLTQWAPLTWREPSWWSLDTNLFTQIVVAMVFLLMTLISILMLTKNVLYPLLEFFSRSRIVPRILPT